MPKIKDIINQIFNRSFSENYFDWKYKQNPFGYGSAYVLKCNDEIVGMAGNSPIQLKVFDQQIDGTQEVDLGVLSTHRKLASSLMLLGKREFDYLKKELFFVLKITNAFSSELIKMANGNIVIGEVPALWLITTPVAYLRKVFDNARIDTVCTIFMKIQSLTIRQTLDNHKYSIEFIKKFDIEFDAFWNKIRSDYHIMIVRKCVYLNWRYANNHGADYKIITVRCKTEQILIGYTVFNYNVVNGIKHCRIFELYTLIGQDDALMMLLKNIKKNSLQNGAMIMDCWMYSHSHMYKTMTTFGFSERKKNRRKLSFTLFDKKKEVDKEEVAVETNWHISIGDSDSI